MGNQSLNWTTKVRSQLGWPHGDNFRCTFDLWDLEDSEVFGFDFIHQFPGATGIFGPFHDTPLIERDIFATIDPGLDFWWRQLSFEEGSLATGIFPVNSYAVETFQQAFADAVGRDNAMTL